MGPTDHNYKTFMEFCILFETSIFQSPFILMEKTDQYIFFYFCGFKKNFQVKTFPVVSQLIWTNKTQNFICINSHEQTLLCWFKEPESGVCLCCAFNVCVCVCCECLFLSSLIK